MARKVLAISLVFFPVAVAIAAWGQGKSLNRIVSEKLIGRVHRSFIAESVRVSPNNRRVAYVAVSGGFFTGYKKFLVVDGKEEKQYDDITATMLNFFSPDSRRVAYGASVGNKWFVVVDGKEEKQYDAASAGPIFSPDNQRVAYSAKVGDKWFVVVDGITGKLHDSTLKGTPIFSPDGKRVGYGAKEGDKQFVVVDGKEGKPYDGIGALVFSPDSQRVAYGAKAGDKSFVVVDGNEGTPHYAIISTGGGRIVFDRPDSFHYLVQRGWEVYLVEERMQ